MFETIHYICSFCGSQERIDVARACLRMDVPRRIRYVLEEMRPPEARTVLSALEVLTRLARSSPAVAQSLLDTPRLMNTLLSCFLPSTWPALSRAESTQYVKFPFFNLIFFSII